MSGKVQKRQLQNGIIPQQDADLEGAVLGAMLLEKDGFAIGLELLNEEVFYTPFNQQLFKAMVLDNEEFGRSDLLLAAQRMRSLTGQECSFAISELTNRVASAANIEFHIRVIQEKYMFRKIVEVSYNFGGLAQQGAEEVFELQARMISELESISTSIIKTKERSAKQLALEVVKELTELHQNKIQGLTGIPSGYKKLDQVTGGWQKTNLIILAARPSVGKTAFVLNLARNAAVGYGIPVAFFSLEMANIELMKRLVGLESKVRGERISHARLEESDWKKITQNLHKLEKAPLYVDDTAGLKLHELRAKARRMKAAYGIEMIVIDYLQLMDVEGNTFNREQEISKISRGLKKLAKELGVPVIALSQLSRDVEKRGGGGRPRLSDLRESGAIEQDADMVMFLWSELKDEGDVRSDGLTQYVRHLDIAKHRNGSVGQADLIFTPTYSIFTERDTDVPILDEYVRDFYIGKTNDLPF